MITLRSMSWSNMFSYGEKNSIDFTKSTVSQILGKNGYGKSTIAHILEELLFNKNSKGYKKGSILNRNINGKSYSGAVEFEKDGDLYRVQVSRTGAVQKVSLFKNDKDISQHTATATYDLIEKLFGRDFKMFSQLVYQNNRSSLQFLTATDTVRKRFLIDLLNLEKYIEIYEKSKEVIKEVTGELNRYTGELNGLESWIKSNKDAVLAEVPLKILLEIPQKLVDEYKEKSQLLNDIDVKNAAIGKNNQYKELRDSIPAEYLTINIQKVDTSDLNSRLAIVKQAIKDNEALKLKVEKLGNFCHVCDQPIDTNVKHTHIVEYKNKIQSLEAELLKLTADLKIANAINSEYDKAQRYIADFERYSGLIDPTIESIYHDKDQVANEVKYLKTELDNLIYKNNEITEWNKAANNNNSKLELIKQQLTTAELNVTRLKLNIESLNKTLNHLEILKKAFSTNGLLAYKLEYSVKELELLTNEYLLELSDGRFQLLYVVNNDKLNIVVKDGDSDVEIEALSSGELARVTTATLLATRKLLASLSTDSINVLFLDEVIDVLDDDGKERLIDVLIKEVDLNTFIVSHGFTHPLLSKIRVDKVKHISKLIND